MKKLLGRIYLTCGGWRQIGEPPREAKCIIVAAPHTSGWDLPPLLGFAWVNGIKLSWMGKHTLFGGRWGWLFRWLGGIPIDRRSRNGVVAQMAAVFEESDRLALAIPVEGTREYREYWKSGFYYIAKQTGVPIVLTVLDWSRKEGGFGPTIWPSDDLGADMDQVRAFYEGRRGKYDGQFSRVRLREEEDPCQVSSGP